MIEYFLNGLKTKELIFTDETLDHGKVIYKKVLDLEGQPFLTFSKINLSDFDIFKKFFKKFGSIYLIGLLDYLFKELYVVSEFDVQEKLITNSYLPGDMEYANDEPILKTTIEYNKQESYLLSETHERNEYIVLKPIINNLRKDISNYLINNIPINLDYLKQIHDFLFFSGKKYYSYNSSYLYERKSIFESLQRDLKLIIYSFENIPDEHTSIYLKTILNQNLKLLKFNSDNNLNLNYTINDLNLNSLLCIEAIYNLFLKKKIASCIFCGKYLIVNAKQLRFYEKNQPLYCSVDCQKNAKNKRGNEKKKLKKEISNKK